MSSFLRQTEDRLIVNYSTVFKLSPVCHAATPLFSGLSLPYPQSSVYKTSFYYISFPAGFGRADSIHLLFILSIIFSFHYF